jgi:glycosyltransferase involved in cell wall biosynthesis
LIDDRQKSHFRKVERITDQEVSIFRANALLVLKAPRFIGTTVVGKGALLLKYNPNFCLFPCCFDLASLLKHYVLVLEPSWSGYAIAEILYFTYFRDSPIVIMAADTRDYEFVKRLGTNLIPVEFGASAWVDPSVFRPLGGGKKIFDAIMVARWHIVKRHHVLFRAICNLKDPSFKVALVAPSLYSNRKEIEILIHSYGIGNNITLFENLSPEEVNTVLNRSKVNLLLSLQEGSNRSLVEGFFAGVPGLALKNIVGFRKDYLTPRTGKLIEEKNLCSELLYFRENWSEYDPRSWAEENITPDITTSKLNRVLKDLAYQRGEEWTVDLVAKCNCPNLRYYPDVKTGIGLPSVDHLLLTYGRANFLPKMYGS